jgi:hypothetical protein
VSDNTDKEVFKIKISICRYKVLIFGN